MVKTIEVLSNYGIYFICALFEKIEIVIRIAMSIMYDI